MTNFSGDTAHVKNLKICLAALIVAACGRQTQVKDNEHYESALKRFKKQCEKAGILSEIRRREFYEKPSVRKKKKALAARKRLMKRLQGPPPGGGRGGPGRGGDGGTGGREGGGGRR